MGTTKTQRTVVRRGMLAGALLLATFGRPGVLTAQSGPDAILIEGATLIDGTGRPPRPGASVLIVGNRIDGIGASDIDVPAGTRRIDGRGKFLIPGLMDMHVHLRGGRGASGPHRQRGIRHLHSYLYSGVTSIYDAGNSAEFILGLRRDERAGRIDSPRIFATGGLVTYPGSHGSSPAATLIDSWPEDRAELDRHLALSPDLLKLTFEERGWGMRPLIPLLPPDLMQEIIHRANQAGVRTTAHTSGEFRARQAIFAGIDTLAHPVIQGPVSEGFVRLIAAKKIPMVSTLTIGEGYSRLAEHPEFLDQPLYRAVIDEAERRRLQTEESERQRTNPWAAWMKLMTPVAQENLRKIHEAGGVVVAGTDQSIGPALHRELELLAAAGIPPLGVIRIATLNAAVFLGMADELGSIEEGKKADLVLLSADPIENIDNAKAIEMVIKDGRIIDRSSHNLPANR